MTGSAMGEDDDQGKNDYCGLRSWSLISNLQSESGGGDDLEVLTSVCCYRRLR